MIFLETPIPFLWMVAGAVIALAGLGFMHARLRRLIRPRYLWGLTGLRFASFVGIIFLLLNPYRLDTQPDREGFRVAVLVDASGSMDTFDLAEGKSSRFELVTKWLTEEKDSPLASLRGNGYQLDISLFAEETVSFTGESRLLPGSTAIGSILRETLVGDGLAGAQLGGVLLISDGMTNAGSSPIEAAHEFRQRGIPISTIGVGSLRPPGEVTGEFASSQYQGEKGQPLELQVRVRNSRSVPEKVRVELQHEEQVIATQEVELAANSEQLVPFSVTPYQTGGQAYHVKIFRPDAPPQTDIAAVEVEEPDTFRILYLAGRPSLELRFLQQALQNSEQISFEAIVQTGEEAFFHLLRPEQETMIEKNFPDDPLFYNGYDAIILHRSALEHLPNDGIALRDFIQHRGGGLLFTGGTTELPEEWRRLLPVAETSSLVPPLARDLTVEAAPAFHEVTGGALFNRPPPFLPAQLPAFVAQEWKRGARPILRLSDGTGIVLGAQAYGAGRVGWLGTENTWRWRLRSDHGLDQHQIFWNHALVWLASSGRPRLDVAFQGKRLPLGQDIDAGIDVRGADFRPARQADVQATVQTPSGETRQIQLLPSLRKPGRFETEFRPDEAGEYRIRYQVALPEGEEISYDAFFIASHQDEERENTAYREDLLRDLARLTGGKFLPYSQAKDLRELPLAEGVPTEETRHYLAQNWLFLLLLAVPLFSEWYIRRKLGLK